MAVPHNELFIRKLASNLNGGSGNTDAALVAYTSKVAAGPSGWDPATGVFFVGAGNPVTDGVLAGMAISLFLVGATRPAFTSIVQARDAVSLTLAVPALHTGGYCGLPPAADPTGATFMRVGGAWAGPSAADAFPWDYLNGTLVDNTTLLAGNAPRVNVVMSTGVVSNATATWTTGGTIQGPIVYEACNLVPGDYNYAAPSRWVMDAGNPATARSLLVINGNNICLRHAEVKNTGTGGSAAGIYGISTTGGNVYLEDVLGHDCWGACFNITGQACGARGLEAYAGNKSNTANGGCVLMSGNGTWLKYAFIHDCPTANTSGLRTDSPVRANHVIIARVGSIGWRCNETTGVSGEYIDIIDCVDGISLATAGNILLVDFENINLLKCSGTAFKTTAIGKTGYIGNINFGRGAYANGTDMTPGMTGITLGPIGTLPAGVTPWKDYASDDFSLTLAQCLNTGDGRFFQSLTAPINKTVIAGDDAGAASPGRTVTPATTSGGSTLRNGLIYGGPVFVNGVPA